jgi:hypothetical protein
MMKPFKNGFFSANIDNKNLPKNNKPFHVKDALTHKIKLYGLKPNQIIFYFAANQRDFTKSIKPRSMAYGKLENSGITRVNKDGEATVYIHCPQLYVNQDGKVYSRHMHFLYWDGKNNIWDKNLYTQELLCTLKKDYIITKNVHIVDARLEGKHIDGYVSMPYNKRWTEEKVLEALQISKTNKLIPILIYSDSTNELYNKLNKLGFYNTMSMSRLVT